MLGTVLYLAVVICAWGFVSLVTDSDVISEDVGPLIGPVIVGLSCVLVATGALFQLRNGEGWLLPILVTVAVYLLPPLLAASLVALDRVDVAAGLLFFAARVTGPFVPIAAILAGALVLAAPAALRPRRTRP